jgi:hypothetical protein
VEEEIQRVWVAAADLESAQQQTDTAQFDLAEAVQVALQSGHGTEAVGSAAGMSADELDRLIEQDGSAP